ncbi:MAG: putative baseplate assembly protein [Myxococcaceae bacterium]|nr:putative baseplate assembly protein [Myxococcaceae bacterium]
MSRPPRPLRSSRVDVPASPWPRDYLPREYADFMALQRELAREELGLISAGEEGDFTSTLMDLSALLAHVLGVYQNRYAREAFLGTAQSARSLVLHGRRLGYEPDAGVSATGFAALTVHSGLEGILPAGFALASSPVGERKGQHYETLTEVRVDARHNALRPVTVPAGASHAETPALDEAYLPGELPNLAPGAYVVLHTLDERVREVAELTFVELFTVQPGARGAHLKGLRRLLPPGAYTRVGWKIVDREGPPQRWRLEDLGLRGNVVPISHGRTMEQVLGDSDGTQPFLRFALDEPRLTHLPMADRVDPVVEVFVGGVRWTRVLDFAQSDGDDRHYLLQRDERQVTYVLFGDGRRGAVPPAGQQHITAVYRVGLGREGNAEPGLVSRIPRAHPLLARATNPLSVRGGTEPSDVRDIRTKATRRVRTFDRAVSVKDHSDLALLFPGVARASARWTRVESRGEGIELVVSTLEGELPGASVLTAMRAFLDARRDASVPLRLRGAEPLDLKVELFLEVAPGASDEGVQQRVRELLHGEREDAPGLFTLRAKEIGEPATLSELHRVLAGVQGADFLGVTRLEPAASETGTVLDVVHVEPHQWVRLRPENLVFTLG